MKNTLVATSLARAAMACLITCGLALSACGSNPDRDRPENPFKKAPQPGDAKAPQSDAELHAQADKLYREAHAAVVASDWTPAAQRLDKLVAAYPFSDYATQAEMEKIWVGYKGGQPDEALGNADRFLRAHPRTAQAEYVQYLKGVINFTRDESFFDAVGINQSPRKDVSNARRSYDEFALLVQRYPTSKFVGDARRRMIFLRNKIADHDLTVAQYYLRRGAFIAAARRAQSVVTEYPGAPATKQALAIIETSYRQAGLTEQANDAAQIIAANVDNKPVATPRPTALGQATVIAPAAYGTADPAAPAYAQTSVIADVKPTLFERFTHLFGISKPEQPYAATAPGTAHGDAAASSVPALPAAASAASSSDQSTATTRSAPSAPVGPAAANAASNGEATPPSTATSKPQGLNLSVGPPDSVAKSKTPDATPSAAPGTP